MANQASLEPVLGQRIAQVLESMRGESASLPTLLDLLKPPQDLPKEFKPPAAPVVTDDEFAALKKLPEVFGKVDAQDRRPLAPVEISDLIRERDVLDVIEKLVEKRKIAIRRMGLNHADVMHEAIESARTDRAADEMPPDRDSDGHYVVASKHPGDGKTGKCLSIEITGSKADLTVQGLRRLVEDPDVPFTQEDFDACTSIESPPPPPLPLRRLSSEGVFAWLRSHPDGYAVMRKALTRTDGSVKFWIRKSA